MTSLYIHIPFCQQKCFYCSFVVSVGQEERMNVYLDALEIEMQLYKNMPLQTIYFGGGTPSLLSVDQLKRLSDMIKNTFDVRHVKEWTIETNPDDINASKINGMLALGIDRFSLGIQTLDDQRLKELGRYHTSKQAKDAFALYKDQSCANVNVDFMFALPHQTLEQLQEDLKHIIALDCQHISLYCLNVEPNSRFFTKAVSQPDDEEQILFYTTIVDLLQQHGWEQYEVSNFAKPDFQSIHNRNYWEGGNYIGLGVGGHSFLDGRRFYNTDKLTDYIEKAQQGVSCVAGEEYLSKHDCFTENILFRLRMNEGVIITELEKRYQTHLTKEQHKRLKQFLEQGLLIQEGKRILASDRGRLLLDELAPYFLS